MCRAAASVPAPRPRPALGRALKAVGARGRRLSKAVAVGAAAAQQRQRSTSVGAGPIEQSRGGGAVGHDGGPESAVERRGEGELVAGVDLELVGERWRRAPESAVWLRRNWLTAASSPPTRAASRRAASTPRSALAHVLARLLDPSLCALALLPCLVGRSRAAPSSAPAAAAAVRARPADVPARLRDRVRGPARVSSSAAIRPAASGSRMWARRRRSVIRAIEPARAIRPSIGLRPRCGPTHFGSPRARQRTRRQSSDARAPRAGRCGGPASPRRPRAAWPPTRARCSTCSPAGTRARRRGLRLGQGQTAAAHVVAGQLPARLQRLALQACVQLRRLGLALERPQPRARLALDIERAVEVVLGAGRA